MLDAGEEMYNSYMKKLQGGFGMSIFGIDWDGDGEIGDIDLVADLFILNEMEKEQAMEEQEFFGNGDDFDNFN